MPYLYRTLVDPSDDELTNFGLDDWEIVTVVIDTGNDHHPIVYLRQYVMRETAEKMKMERALAERKAKRLPMDVLG